MREDGFLHIRGAHFLTWWPLGASPVLTGWSGGPRAQHLSTESNEIIRSTAIAELAKGLAASEGDLRKVLVEASIFNWQRDASAMGAYSYATVGGAVAFERLAAPVADTLFFAGEATAGKLAATVGGAIRSGYLAADEILRLLR